MMRCCSKFPSLLDGLLKEVCFRSAFVELKCKKQRKKDGQNDLSCHLLLLNFMYNHFHWSNKGNIALRGVIESMCLFALDSDLESATLENLFNSYSSPAENKKLQQKKTRKIVHVIDKRCYEGGFNCLKDGIKY
ncbi:hypothetical protein SDJN02_21574, partial [Cucurbita argyrosperma subsp. argyrosperma]